jgi:hypothetical protein
MRPVLFIDECQQMLPIRRRQRNFTRRSLKGPRCDLPLETRDASTHARSGQAPRSRCGREALGSGDLLEGAKVVQVDLRLIVPLVAWSVYDGPDAPSPANPYGANNFMTRKTALPLAPPDSLPASL